MAWLVWGAVALFLVWLLGVVGSVLVNSFGERWFDTWLPAGWTTQWYRQAWTSFGLFDVIVTTLEVALAVVVLSVVAGVPAAYVLARRPFPGKQVLWFLFLLPIMMPPITYGIPLATVLYKVGLAGNLSGVILANLVPCVPFVVLTMTPFIEQIDPAIENAARMSGAGTFSVFTRILAPLLLPGILASSILVLVRTVGMFELTFLTAGPTSSTLVVALFNSMNAAGIRAQQSVDAMAVIYMLVMLVLLVTALRFVNPTQLVSQVKEEPPE
ncbi:ABC transporter permease [Kineosporia corallincola]